MPRTLVTQSRIASLIASFRVFWPASTPRTSAPMSRIAEDIQRLPGHVHRAHVDHALKAKLRAHRRRGDAVLAGASFGDHAFLSHAAGQQRLSERVVDLVRPRCEAGPRA